MRTKSFLIALVAMLLPFVLSAEEFRNVKIGGVCYNLTYLAGKLQEAEVTKSDYSGDVSILNRVTYNGVSYSVTSIGSYAFEGCSGLTSITIPNSVKSIGEEAFNDCNGLTSVNISDLAAWCNIIFSLDIELECRSNPLRYAQHLYINGNEITNLVIPNSVTSISDYAFYNCSGLTSVTIPNSVTSIGKSAFSGCEGLTSVNISDLAAWCNIEFGRNNPLNYAHHLYINGNEITNLVIPSTITSISDYAFEGCSGLTSVTIPNSVTSIGSSAFRSCSGLTSLTIPNSVTSIGSSAFSGCKGLTSVTIPNSVTSIGSSAFYNCSGLTSVTIPNSVTSIGRYAFGGCSVLTSITIPNSVKSIGEGVFTGCTGLTNMKVPVTDYSAFCNYNRTRFLSTKLGKPIQLIDGKGTEIKEYIVPNSVKSIGNYAFYNCSGLTSVTIPNSVTSIGESAFRSCSGLTSLTIPNSVTSIKDYAFAYCENLSDVVCLAKNVPNTLTSSFDRSYIEYATLHVYETSVEAYKAKAPWNKFKSIVAADIPMYTLTYMVDGAVYKTVKYEEGDNINAEATPKKEGYIFSGWDDIPKIMPAENVTITGSFTIAKFKLTYLVDGEEYKSYDMKYGSTIIPETEPAKEGYTFSGWSEIPEEMPAHDVVVSGTFTKIHVEEPQLTTPGISIIKGKLVFTCEETDVTYHYGITTPDIQGDGNDVELPHSYRVSVYASKEGFQDSEIATKDINIQNGDVNLDGKVDVEDHVELTNIIMSETENVEDAQ